MWKVFGGVVVGVFVGALAFEVLNRWRPQLITKVEGAARGHAKSFTDAFAQGYHRTPSNNFRG